MQGPYYVYFHVRPDTGRIFYIGKGKGRRCFTKRGRNADWHNVVLMNNGSFEVRIALSNLLEVDAFLYEKYLIDFYSREDVEADVINKTHIPCSHEVKNLIEWINSHPLILISPLAESCDIDRGNMHKYLKGADIPEKHLSKIEAILSDYGYQKEK